MDKELYPRLSALKPKNAPPYWRPEVTWHSHVQPVAACSVHRLPDVSQDGATPESTRIRSPQSSPQTAPQNDPHRSPLSAPSRLSAPQVQQLAPQPQYPYSDHAPTNTTIHQHEWRCAPSPSPSDSCTRTPSSTRIRNGTPPRRHPAGVASNCRRPESVKWHDGRVAGSVGALRARQSCVGGTAPVAGRRPHRPSSGSSSTPPQQRVVVCTAPPAGRRPHRATGGASSAPSTPPQGCSVLRALRGRAREDPGEGVRRDEVRWRPYPRRSAVASLPKTQCGGVPTHNEVRPLPYASDAWGGVQVQSKWTRKWKSGSESESTRAVTPRATLRPPCARTGSVLARPLRGEGANDKWTRKVGVEVGANPTRTRAVTPRAAPRSSLLSLHLQSSMCRRRPFEGEWNKWQMGAQSGSGSGSEPTCRDAMRRSPLSALRSLRASSRCAGDDEDAIFAFNSSASLAQ
ncbi:hypothetical protein B0H10DRAFT_2222883 [Mycena sp. CBHHK59/15]|nr:hypothetical protein B0H10DRAFT_2222883 [Mycena sp. CBHHK59/15]